MIFKKLKPSNMKSTALKFLLLFAAISSIYCMCCKENATDPDKNNGNGLPDDSKAYVAYYANAVGINEPHYGVATFSSPFIITTHGDTTFLNFEFRNKTLENDDTQTNFWDLCDSTYDFKGHDRFLNSIEWTGETQGELTVGATYNLSHHKDGAGNWLSISDTRGASIFVHAHANNAVVVSFNTYFGGNGGNVAESYLKIEKMENNTASGSFSLSFGSVCELNSNGFQLPPT
jgi:hypothetical protein